MSLRGAVGGGDALAAAQSALAFPRASLGHWPTPLMRRTTPTGPILVKRDDLSGFGRGGAKTRKIEALIGHMTDRGHDQLVTVAGNISNLVFDLLPALDRYGIDGRLLIVDDPPAAHADREQIFALVRHRVELLGSSRVGAARRAVCAYREARATGRRPLLVLPGVTHPAAVLANAAGMVELAAQCLADGEPLPATVFVSVATGTTLAGFLLGAAVLHHVGFPRVRVIGVQVYPGPIRLLTRVLLRVTCHRLGISPRAIRVEIDRSALAGGFGRYPEHLRTLCARVEQDVGLRIDPIFGGKAWWVMERMRSDQRVREPCLYWHCGFTSEWEQLAHAVRRGPFG